ncbi:unnamed protein product [Adineta steineri]|uniref:F-box domain-containing protein n=1 Tax=Adineta steineri TaxID=433720 RepID=A0A814WQE8_9BILA|nr:unnamed protein product [Adineta steineri]
MNVLVCFSSLKEFNTCFEDLSNELIYEIFDLLDFHHVYQAFDSLNARFYNLVTNSTLPIEVNLSSISKSTFERYNKDIILPNKHRIHSLHLSNPCLYDDISSPIHILSQFLHLKTLSLNNIESKHLEYLLPTLVSLPCLSSLSITSINIIVNRTAIYSQIIRLPALKYCSLSLKGSHYSEVPLPILDKYSPIEHLIIKHGISTNELYNLLSYIPQLHRLYVCYTLNSWTTYIKPSSFVLPYLTHVSLDLSSISFAVFEEMIIDIFHLVHVLHIFIRNNNDQMYINANRWKQLILSYMRNLRIFDIRHETWSRNITTNSQVILNTPTNKFTSSFWSERQWFFTQQFIQERDRNCTIFCSIDPYRRKYYTLCKQIHPSTCLNSKKTHLQSVQHLRIDNENEIIDCKYYFPNVTTLTLENSLSCTLIKSRSLSLTKIIEILRFTSYIRTLIFGSMPLYGVNYKSIQQNQTFQLVSNTNMITNVTFKQGCTLNKLQLFVALCPRIQYLTLGHDTEDLESIVRFLLKKRNENTSHLCSIRLVSTCPFFLTTLRTLIESETLLTDYILKKVDLEHALSAFDGDHLEHLELYSQTNISQTDYFDGKRWSKLFERFQKLTKCQIELRQKGRRGIYDNLLREFQRELKEIKELKEKWNMKCYRSCPGYHGTVVSVQISASL